MIDRLQVLVSHPIGNQFVRHLVARLLADEKLGLFATSVGFPAETRWIERLPRSLRRELERRAYSVPRKKMHTRPFREATRLAARKMGMRRLLTHERGWASIDQVFRDLDESVAHLLPRWHEAHGVGTVYGYEDGCHATFHRARTLGLKRVYDLPIAHWQISQRLLREEAARLPKWEPTLGGTRDSQEKLDRKSVELDLADIVVCPSPFVADSLPEKARREKTVVTVPFGTPTQGVPDSLRGQESRFAKNGRLRVLFAGGMSQRKGLGDLFTAMRSLARSDVELVVMGTPIVPMDFYRKEFSDFRYEATRPHEDVLALMRTCNVLILPSIVEGRALVMQEAMSQGLPVIITPNTGGADLVDEGVTGFLIPIREPRAIAEKVDWCADNREALKIMGQAAARKAAVLTWDAYAGQIVAALS